MEKDVEKKCKDLGVIKKYTVDRSFFGNIELEIETPHKVLLYVRSDRGEFSCYVIKRRFLYGKKFVSIADILKCDRNISFGSLESAIDYLKSNLEIIENAVMR